MGVDTAFQGIPALVLGGDGFIGRHVANALSARGARVHLVVRRSSSIPTLSHARPAGIHVADLSQHGSAAGVLEAVNPAVVFNLAGYGVDHTERDPALMTALNDTLVAEVCNWLAAGAGAHWSGARLVHVGSALEYGPVTGPLHEAIDPAPTTSYGRSKLAGTRTVARYGADRALSGVVARLFSVYGPGEHPDRLLPSLLRAADAGRDLDLTTGEQRRDFTYVADVAEGLLRLATAHPRPGEVVHLASGHLISVREFAETAGQVLGLAPAALHFGVVPPRLNELRHGHVDIQRLEALTSWRPSTPLAEGIRKTRTHVHDH